MPAIFLNHGSSMVTLNSILLDLPVQSFPNEGSFDPTLNPAEPINRMKRPRLNYLLFSLIVFANAALPALAVTVTTLPASLAAPLNSSTNRGFLIRTAQGWTTNGPMANSYTRAYKQ